MHGAQTVLSPGGPAMDLAQRRGQQVTVLGGLQKALAEPVRQLLPSVLQRDGVQQAKCVLVGYISGTEDNPKTPLLDPLDPGSFLAKYCLPSLTRVAHDSS